MARIVGGNRRCETSGALRGPTTRVGASAVALASSSCFWSAWVRDSPCAVEHMVAGAACCRLRVERRTNPGIECTREGASPHDEPALDVASEEEEDGLCREGATSQTFLVPALSRRLAARHAGSIVFLEDGATIPSRRSLMGVTFVAKGWCPPFVAIVVTTRTQ